MLLGACGFADDAAADEFLYGAPAYDDLGPADLSDASAAFEDAEEEGQVPQMSQQWWDLHYREVMGGGNITSDPREPADPTKSIFGNDLNDKAHFDVAMAHAECLLRPLVRDVAGLKRGPLRVLIVGCGLSPLVFALADRGLGEVSCLEVSPTLVHVLREASAGLPRGPQVYLGDITRLAHEREAQELEEACGLPVAAGDEELEGGDPLEGVALLAPESFDVVIDENVLDGMGCTFPVEFGRCQQRRLLSGVRRLLRPGGQFLALSFMPLVAEGIPKNQFSAALAHWRPRPLATISAEAAASGASAALAGVFGGEPTTRPLLYASLYERPA